MLYAKVLVNCPSRRIIDSHYIALDLTHQIWFPGMYCPNTPQSPLVHASRPLREVCN